MDGFDHAAATILYVDDEEIARKYFVRTVACEHEVIVAGSADEALDILESEGKHIAILVSDYRMPGDNGDKLLRQAKFAYPNVVRILVTAYADKDVLLKTVNSSEVFRILEKPLDMAEVRSTLMLARDLWQKRMARQQKLKAIDEMLVFIAREINTPLTTIINFASGIERRLNCCNVSVPHRSEIEFAATAMSDNAQYCLSVLSGFVESVQNAGAQAAGTGAAVSQIISSLLDTYPLPTDHCVRIHVDIKQDFRISELPNCVSLVLGSVLANALRALKQRPAPQIRMTALVDGHPQILIYYIGTGIPSDFQDNLLSVPVISHEKDGGGDWGLIFCDRIMRTIGGSIVVRPEPGMCTTVTLNFPVLKKMV